MDRKKIAVVFYGDNKFMAQVADELAKTFDVELVVCEKTSNPRLPAQPMGVEFIVTDNTMAYRTTEEWATAPQCTAYNVLAQVFDAASYVTRIHELTGIIEGPGLPWAVVAQSLNDHAGRRVNLAKLLVDDGFKLLSESDLAGLADNCVLLVDHHAPKYGVVEDVGDRKHVFICPCCFGGGSFKVEATLSHVPRTAIRLLSDQRS
jgi:hypothetical protein